MNAAVVLDELGVSYRGHPAVQRVSGRFEAGSFTAVVGPNGAGKSSLLAAIAGTARHEGRIVHGAARRIAYLPQAARLDRGFPVRVREAVAMGLWPRIGSFRGVAAGDRPGIDGALAAVGLDGLDRRWVGELSAGQLQRVLFARLLLQEADLILLDEPFNAIDARTTADLLALLPRWKRQARTVIAVLHDLDQVRQHFEQTLLLAREALAWGPTAHMLDAEPLRRARRAAESWDERAPLRAQAA